MNDKDVSQPSGREPSNKSGNKSGAKSEEAGYKRPPTSKQFPPGKSGNPKGRPRKRQPIITERQERTYFFTAMEETVWVTFNGKRKQVPAIVAVYQVIFAKAIQGDVRCARLILELRGKFVLEWVTQQARFAELHKEILDEYKRTGKLSDETVSLLEETRERINNPINL